MTSDLVSAARRLVDEVVRSTDDPLTRLGALRALQEAVAVESERATMEHLYRARRSGVSAQSCADALGWQVRTAAAHLREYEDLRGLEPVTFRPNVGPLEYREP